MIGTDTKTSIYRLFNPKVVAVVGASSKITSVGYALLKNLIGSNYQGIVHPVNTKRHAVLGVRCYSHVRDIPERVDLVLIAIKSQFVPEIIRECGECGVAGVVIVSAGFSEGGDIGQQLTSDILELAKRYKIRILGPKSLGFIRPRIGLNASFATKSTKQGNIAFISQSGTLCSAVLDWADGHKMGFSCFVSIGSAIDLNFADLIDFFGKDPDTHCIVLYMESLLNAKKFLSAARSFARTKPLIVLKAGKSREGATTALSHTGSLCGDDLVYDAAFKRCGLIRVHNTTDMYDTAHAISMQKRPRGNRLAIVGNGGGGCVIATDTLIELGGVLSVFSAETMQKLDSFLPSMWSHENPVQLLSDATPDRYHKALEIIMKDPNVDGVLVLLTPQHMTDPTKVARAVVEVVSKDYFNGKTFVASWMGASDVIKGTSILEKGKICTFSSPERAVRCFMNLYHYTKNLEDLYQIPGDIPSQITPDKSAVRDLIRECVQGGRFTLNELEAKNVLKCYEIPILPNGVANSVEEAVRISSEIGYPVVLKILSPDILHKTDIGAIVTNVWNVDSCIESYHLVMEAAKKHYPKANINGIFIEKMDKRRHELLIGSKTDKQFGPVIVFGLGGVAVEVFNDTQVGLPPLNMHLADSIIKSTRIFELLKGYRNVEPVDISSIQFLLYKFSYLLTDFPEILEVDINPFSVDAKGGVVLDAKIILNPETCCKPVRRYEHLAIHPYPQEYVTTFTMQNGQEALLRPVRPEDEPLMAEMFSFFSERTQRFRFFSVIRDITHELLSRYTQIDYNREISIIALVDHPRDPSRKAMAGAVRLISFDDPTSADFAIVVADPWQRKGLGNKLQDYILSIAKERGLLSISADVLKENFGMTHMFRKRGFELTPEEDCYHAEASFSTNC